MKNTLKESLQEKLEDNFNIFLNIEINGVVFEIMPIQKDIPIIDYVIYSPEGDLLEVKFASKKSFMDNKRQNEFLSYLIDKENNVVGFKVNNVKKLLKNLTAEKLKSKLYQNIKERLKDETDIKEAIKNNIEKRNLQSLRDFFLSEAKEFELK